jgi:hypothetical protein
MATSKYFFFLLLDSDGAMTTSSTTTTSSNANLPNINYIMGSLSSGGNAGTVSERLKAMKDLTELIKAGNRPECKWNENFKTILFCLFNHLDTAFQTSANLTTLDSNNLDQVCEFMHKEKAIVSLRF